MSDQRSVDARIQHYYAELFDEGARLTTRSPQGPVEFLRVQEIIRERISGGQVLDVGGGTGVHSLALRDAGYDVELLDPVPQHVERASAAGVPSRVGDARDLPFSDSAFDAALLLGPLYHLAERHDRLRALSEAGRVVRPGGFVFAGALSRYIAYGSVALGGAVPDPYPSEWVALAAVGEPPSGMRFPAGHFHTAEELLAEVESAGLEVDVVVGVEGPGGGLLESIETADESLVQSVLHVARAAAAVPGIRDMSAHLLAVARVCEGTADIRPE